MKKYVSIYCNHFGIGEQDCPMCEWCDTRIAVDIHHIYPRGMGGSKNKDYIENLMGLCRICHTEAEAKKLTKEELKQKHLQKLEELENS